MKLSLPSRRGGGENGVVNLAPRQCVLIVGANGAGKTRFTAAVAKNLRHRAYPVNALDALYRRAERNSDLPEPIKKILSPAVVAMYADGNATTLELLLAQLMNDEMLNLIAYKLALVDSDNVKLKATRLDKVIELWQDVFPGNRVLIDSGKILFTRGIDPDSYSSLRLSDGERAVLYYVAAVLYAPEKSVIFVDAPEIFLHPSITASLWNRLEACRSDCTFCYTTHDTEFASSRNGAPVVWVRDCDLVTNTWDYDILPAKSGMTTELYMTLIGARKPVMFIEGDSERSIDAKLYPLIFPDYNVKSLGSCNKVIEATRTFNDLSTFHKMDSCGIVDRDRRDDAEVDYLRRKKIMVPDVAEIENMLLIEEVVATMAEVRGADAKRVVSKVKRAVLSLFRAELEQQALMHTRHRVKRTMEYRVDARSADIDAFDEHLHQLLHDINPREIYRGFLDTFQSYLDRSDYRAVLRVFNQKSMLIGCNVAQLCGYNNKYEYVDGILDTLRTDTPAAARIRAAVRHSLTGE